MSNYIEDAITKIRIMLRLIQTRRESLPREEYNNINILRVILG